MAKSVNKTKVSKRFKAWLTREYTQVTAFLIGAGAMLTFKLVSHLVH